MIYILAGREDQAKDWAHSQGLVWRKEARYLFDSRDTTGDRGRLYVRVGNWYLHQDTSRHRELEHMLQARGWIELRSHNFRESEEYQAMVAQ